MLPRRALVMGVLNVTPDSFSDGGLWFDHEAAVEHGRALLAEGADIVDVGGESTRPGAEPVAVEEELRRVVPVVEALAGSGAGGRISIDTRRAEVAEAAVAAGATIINDVSASLWPVAARHPGTTFIAMHMQGEPRSMQQAPHYEDVVAEVRAFLVGQATAARQAGVSDVWIDPGIGFGKTFAHNLSLLRHLGVLVDTGFPVVVGASRKAFLRHLAGSDDPTDVIEASLAAAVAAVAAGAAVVRVHDVAPTVEAVRIVSEEVAA